MNQLKTKIHTPAALLGLVVSLLVLADQIAGGQVTWSAAIAPALTILIQFAVDSPAQIGLKLTALQSALEAAPQSPPVVDVVAIADAVAKQLAANARAGTAPPV